MTKKDAYDILISKLSNDYEIIMNYHGWSEATIVLNHKNENGNLSYVGPKGHYGQLLACVTNDDRISIACPCWMGINKEGHTNVIATSDDLLEKIEEVTNHECCPWPG